jgi:hypothetical protein
MDRLSGSVVVGALLVEVAGDDLDGVGSLLQYQILRDTTQRMRNNNDS